MDVNPFETIRALTSGYVLSRSLLVVASLGVADVLDDTPRSAAHLARAVGADADALYRTLRLLAAHGTFEATADGFKHNAASRLLRSDDPTSMRDFVRMFAGQYNWPVYEHLESSVRSGRRAADKVLPGGPWKYYAEHPEQGAIFNGAMAAKAHGQVAGVIRTYDFSGFGLIADIGGGRGQLLRAVLDAAPRSKGILFDLPNVIEESKALHSPRLALQGGDFFRDALPVADVYLVMEIIHDWGDAESLAILRAIRKAAPKHAKLLLIETLVTEDAAGRWAKLLDIHMMVLLGGKQRSVEEYSALLGAAGFTLQRTLDTQADISILEATPS